MNQDFTLPKVLEFMTFFGQEVNEAPKVSYPSKVIKLRLGLNLEENDELADALGGDREWLELLKKKVEEVENRIGTKIHNKDKFEADPVKVFDALCDMRYVADGAVLTFGFGTIFSEGMTEVHSSNMTKLCADENEAQQTLNAKIVETGHKFEDYSIKPMRGKLVVIRNDDKKVIKNVFYKEAVLEPIVNKIV